MKFLAFSPGPWELILILFVILLLFGAKKLPSLARSLGQSLTEFKRGKDDIAAEIKSSVESDSEDTKS